MTRRPPWRVPWWRLPWRTRRAMAASWLSGRLMRIRTWQTFYTVVDHVNPDGTRSLFNPDGGFNTVASRRRAPCRTSTRLLTWAMRHDHEHFDHWGLRHTSREKFLYRCRVCGGGAEIWVKGPGLHDEDE